MSSKTVQPWPRGRCEYPTSDRSMCGKKGRWMVGGFILCGQHAKEPRRRLALIEADEYRRVHGHFPGEVG